MYEIPKTLTEEDFMRGLPDPKNSSGNPSHPDAHLMRGRPDPKNSSGNPSNPDAHLMSGLPDPKNSSGNPSNPDADAPTHGDVEEYGEPGYEMHILTGKERRKKMKDMFTLLHSLLPDIPSQVDNVTVVDEAISYIKTLEKKLDILKKQKREKFEAAESSTFTSTNVLPSPLISTSMNALVGFDTWTAPNLSLSICEGEAHFNVCWPKTRLDGFTKISYVLEKYNLVVVSAQLSSDSNKIMCMVHARTYGHGQMTEALQVVELFKQAAIEILGQLAH